MKRLVRFLILPMLVLSSMGVSAAPAFAQNYQLNDIHLTATYTVGVPSLEIDGTVQGTTSGANESFVGDVAAAGVEVGVGSLVQSGNGGSEPVKIPLEHSVGDIHDGEQVVVNVNGVETAGLQETASSSVTKTLTCHLDSQGTGTCS